ncbi:MAG: TraR/DksA family transcriptional regulator [Victivallales bacterium]|nr:TraR/DksA family transcriptional regulator [Victivallales bacterium]
MAGVVEKNVFTGKKKKYYDLLMHARAMVLGQLQFHTDEALNKNDADQENRGMGTHMADNGDSNLREMELQLMTEEGNVVRMIEDAIRRLENDEYGICQDCGAEIPEARLEMKPYAIYCVKCKGIREKNNGVNPYVD